MSSNSIFISNESALVQSELPELPWGVLVIIKINTNRVNVFFTTTLYSNPSIAFVMYGKPITYNNGYITGNWISIANK